MPPCPIKLLSIVEAGGYPDFYPLYERLGFEVHRLSSMRKALKFIKATPPNLIVAEFNFQSDFRDRTSSLESMMSVVTRSPQTKTLIFYDLRHQHQFERLKAHYHFDAELPFPIDTLALESNLKAFMPV